MSKAKVKKALGELDRAELIEVIMEMYSARKEARDYLEYWIYPDMDRQLDDLKVKLNKIFFMSVDKPRRKPDYTDISVMVKNFESLGPSPEQVCDLYLSIPEKIVEWLGARNCIGIKSASKKVYAWLEKAKEAIEKSGLEDMFGMRHDRTLDAIDQYVELAERIGTGRRGYRRYLRW